MFAKITFLAVISDKSRFEVKSVQMACGSTHEKLDDTFGFGWMM